MPNCDFYGTPKDHAPLLQWLLEERTCRIFELSSQSNCPLRAFESADDIQAEFHSTDLAGQPRHSIYLQLYVLGASPPFQPRRIELNPATCGGATFRFAAEGLGLVQLYLSAPTQSGLSNSHTNHNSQKRADTWSTTDEEARDLAQWDFKKIGSFSARLNRKISSMGAAKIGSRPVLPDALTLWNEGMAMLPFTKQNATAMVMPGDIRPPTC